MFAGQPDFVPVTYLLPADYTLFVEEFRRNPNAMVRATRSLLVSVCVTVSVCVSVCAVDHEAHFPVRPRWHLFDSVAACLT